MTDPFSPALDIRDALTAGRLSAETVTRAALERIAALDGALGAFVTVDAEGALARARALDRLAPEARGPLHGLPVAIKDLTDTKGLRTTYGSTVFARHVPDRDDHVVERLRAAGAVVVGKSNTPEFGFGAVCANAVAGTTRNPFDPRLTSGGSSGGAAVAVASGMVPLAHGTDFGGSVRTPASFCGIVAFRPTPGAIAAPQRRLGWDRLSTHGVMGRTVADCAAMLKAMLGRHDEDPASLCLPTGSGAAPARLAQTADFGVAPVSLQVRERFAAALDALSTHLGPLERAEIDCRQAGAAFRILRAAHVHHAYAHLLKDHRDDLMPTARWNIEAGAGLSARDYLDAEEKRTELTRRFMRYFRDIDVLVAPAAALLPWPVEDGEVLAIDGEKLPDILDYLAPTYIISLVGFPVLTLPAPLPAPGALPFGIQLIGRPGSDLDLLAFGRRLEDIGFRFVPPPLGEGR